AFLFYLIGAEPTPGGMRLRPHLPNNHSEMAIDHISAGSGSGSLTLWREGTKLRASFTSEADEAFELQMELPGSGGALPGGELVTVHDTVVVEPGEIVEY
ncbi:MAG: hypothetical protein HN348_32510, partial [Proteobacteria bacterium]|nr:hypothetical protein [Pseudomonadota bacterium]